MNEPAGPCRRARGAACVSPGSPAAAVGARPGGRPGGPGHGLPDGPVSSGQDFPGAGIDGERIRNRYAGVTGIGHGKCARKASGVPGAGRRRQYVSPGYQACTSIRLSGTSPARRASRGWSRVGTRQPYSDARSVTPFYVGSGSMGTPRSKTFTGVRRAADRKLTKIRNAARRKSQGSGSIRGISIHWGGSTPGFFASLLPGSGRVLKAFF